jgi:hypothetical protein
MLSTALVPTITLIAEAIQKADGSQRLMTMNQPAPIPKRVPENTINPVTRRPYKEGEVVREQQQMPVSKEGKATAQTADPIEMYEKEQRDKASKAPVVKLDQEVVSKRTPNTRTFKNSHGSETTRIYSEPVNYKSNGSWKSVKGSLKEDVNYNKNQLDKLTLGTGVLPKNGFVPKSVQQEDGLLRLNF